MGKKPTFIYPNLGNFEVVSSFKPGINMLTLTGSSNNGHEAELWTGKYNKRKKKRKGKMGEKKEHPLKEETAKYDKGEENNPL